MVALPARQPNEPAPGTYPYMLKSEDTLTPFNKKSTPQEIEEKLQELHKQETSHKKIKELLKNRKARLEKMIACIDVETSPRSLNRKFIHDLCEDFDKQIKTVIYLLPASVYIGIWDEVKNRLTNAIKELHIALGALVSLDDIIAIEKAGTSKINKIIREKSKLYKALLAATEHIEEALSKWDTTLPDQSDTDDEDQAIQEGEVKKENLPEYLDNKSKSLSEQFQSFKEKIYYPLLSIGSNLLQEREIEDIEAVLRIPILEILLAIPAKTMPDDEESQALITRSKIHYYISYKSVIIRNLRLVKIALNLALDRYELTKPLRKVRIDDLDKDITPCTECLDQTFQILKETP